MFGAIVGDLAGFIYAWHNAKAKERPALGRSCAFVDDAVAAHNGVCPAAGSNH